MKVKNQPSNKHFSWFLINTLQQYILLDVFCGMWNFVSKLPNQSLSQFLLKGSSSGIVSQLIDLILINFIIGNSFICYFRYYLHVFQLLFHFIPGIGQDFLPDLFSDPFNMSSPKDLWSRWHQVFRRLFILVFYKPVVAITRPIIGKHPSSALGIMMVFIGSGLLHEFSFSSTVLGCSTHYGPMIFFISQGLILILQPIILSTFSLLGATGIINCIPRWVGTVFTYSLVCFTAIGLFLPFIKVGPSVQLYPLHLTTTILDMFKLTPEVSHDLFLNC